MEKNMDVTKIIDQDPRIKAIKNHFKALAAEKNQKIKDISNIEADIVKLQGKYEVVSKEIIEKIKSRIDEAKDPGNRNNTLMEIGQKYLSENSMSIEQVKAALQEQNKTLFETPLSDDEVDNIVKQLTI